MRQVLIIDDHPGVGQALALLLSLHDIETSVAASPEEGLALLDQRAYGLVIQDMNFSADTTSGAEGEQLFRAIRTRRPDLPVILLTTFDDTAAFDEAVRAGAKGFLLKAISPETLAQALRDVHAGGTALRPSLTTRMEARSSERAFTAADHPDPLSPKELQVLRLVASGRSNTEIASLLGNSEGVIKNHCSAIFSKMGVRDRTQAVLRAIDLGWI